MLALPAAAAALSKPVITALSPSQGPALGGTTLVIHGRNFKSDGKSIVRVVRFGPNAATRVHVSSATKLTCRAPLGVGVVNVRVVTKAGTSGERSADHYAYQGGPPVVTVVSPGHGPAVGGTTVTITGSGFTGTTSVAFVSSLGLSEAPAAKFTVESDNSIVAISPAQNPFGDNYDVTVTTPLGTSPAVEADRFDYYPSPSVASVSPANGSPQGGTTVTISGTGLFTATSAATSVKFGSVAAKTLLVESGEIKATAPAGTGTVDVTVTTYGGTSAVTSNDRFCVCGDHRCECW